jgi:ABC-type dipeptide/oligopeptide/nickel transport system permease component
VLSITSRYIVILAAALSLLYGLLNTIPDSRTEERINLFSWLERAVEGELTTRNYHNKITFLGDEGDEDSISLGAAFLSSFVNTSLAVMLIWIVSTFLNTALVGSSEFLKKFATPISKILGLISNIHVMVMGLILYIVLNGEISLFGLIIIIGLSSNIYYDIESEQRLYFSDILNKDYVLNARAMGDSVFNHILKPVSTFSITQLLGVWPSALTNAMFVEIIFQESGIGSLLFQNILAPAAGSSLDPEIDVLMYVASIIVISILAISYIKECILFKLVK